MRRWSQIGRQKIDASRLAVCSINRQRLRRASADAARLAIAIVNRRLNRSGMAHLLNRGDAERPRQLARLFPAAARQRRHHQRGQRGVN